MNNDNYDCCRRDFLKVAGLGAAALTVSSIGMVSNSRAASVSTMKQEKHTADVLIIGGGMAGAFAAMKAKEAGADVILVEKGSVCKSGCTPFARGFSFYDKNTNTRTKEQIMDECSEIGEYMQNRTYLKLALDKSKELADEVMEWGIFGTQKFGGIIADKVVQKGVEVIERTMMTSLIMHDGHVAGAIGFPLDEDDKAIVIHAKSVVMCTGASGFKPNGYPINSLTADGDAMAYRVGAEIGGKEFNDTHWTFYENPASCYDNWKTNWEPGLKKSPNCGPLGGLDLRFSLAAHTGQAPILQGNSPKPSKGPPPPFMRGRSSGRMQGGGGGRSRGGGYGASGMRQEVGGGRSRTGRFRGGGFGAPGLRQEAGGGRLRTGRSRGGGFGAPGMRLDDRQNPSVGGAAAGKSVHKAEGLFPQDDKCSSNIPGLFAAGDSLSSMHNGADYSSGVSSCCTSGIQGSIAGRAAAEYVINVTTKVISKTELDALKNELFAPRGRDKGFSPGWVTQILQNTMIPYFVLFVKKKERMEAALTTVEFIRDHFVPLLIARDTHELRLAHETKNMVLNAEMKLRAGLFRTESRGSHYREDYPARDDANWLAYVKLNKNNKGDMALAKVRLPKEWAPDYSISYEERYPLRYPGEAEYLAKHSRLKSGT